MTAKENLQEKFMNRLGSGGPPEIKRSECLTDEEWIEKNVARDLKIDSAEYRAARRKYEGQLADERERQRQMEADVNYMNEYRSKAKLSEKEIDRIERESAQFALADAEAGKITKNDIARQQRAYRERLTSRALDQAASDRFLNDYIRNEIKAGTFPDA